jgi:tetratricopeptide (TPR) repeat protein
MLCAGAASAQAQTLAEAQALYNKGKYQQAMPTFQKYVKSQPSNGSYNLYYGVCCLKTGKAAEGLKYLQTAVNKKTPGGQFYLAQAYNDLYQFEEAIDNYEDYIADLTKKKRPTDEAEALLSKAKTNLRMLKSVEKVCVIDSFVVDKDKFLDAYKISEETGKIDTHKGYFSYDVENDDGTVFVSELGDKIYFGARDTDNTVSIFTATKLQKEWGMPVRLPDRINAGGDSNYPFVMPDGVTIYYASNGSNSIGGYDIFVTRYNTETDGYFTPENMGMPFNSPYNDYMYVVDEYNNLGWFASDRFQPDGKVCVYVFVPNESRNSYDYESMDEDVIIRLAKLSSIKETWNEYKEEVDDGLQRLDDIIKGKATASVEKDFTFIIDDDTNYHQISQFKSDKAKGLFKQLQAKEKDLNKMKQSLAEMRETYANAGNQEKKNMTEAILDLETSSGKLADEIDALTKEILKEEFKVVY